MKNQKDVKKGNSGNKKEMLKLQKKKQHAQVIVQRGWKVTFSVTCVPGSGLHFYLLCKLYPAQVTTTMMLLM